MWRCPQVPSLRLKKGCARDDEALQPEALYYLFFLKVDEGSGLSGIET
jgi:hypothetical protein